MKFDDLADDVALAVRLAGPIVDGMPDEQDYDAAKAALGAVPDGWAKLAGRWVQIAPAFGHEVTGPSGRIDGSLVLVTLPLEAD